MSIFIKFICGTIILLFNHTLFFSILIHHNIIFILKRDFQKFLIAKYSSLCIFKYQYHYYSLQAFNVIAQLLGKNGSIPLVRVKITAI